MRRPRPMHRRRRSGRIRALLSVGLLFGITQVGTLASWTDSATVQGGNISSGTLDLTVGDSSANQLSGPGGTWTYSTLTLAAMAPGESTAWPLTVGNGGSVALTYNATVVTSNNDLQNGLQLTVVEGATVGNTGTQAANNRVGHLRGRHPHRPDEHERQHRRVQPARGIRLPRERRDAQLLRPCPVAEYRPERDAGQDDRAHLLVHRAAVT